MPSQHKHPSISFRPPEPDRLWLLAFAKRTGRAVNAIIAEALSEYRSARTSPPRDHSTETKDEQ